MEIIEMLIMVFCGFCMGLGYGAYKSKWREKHGKNKA